jgi:hydroxymethylpyrimidine/phosphomethylpyrimidine kinase
VALGARAALVKGGHLNDSAYDVLYDAGTLTAFDAPRVVGSGSHGTGCTLSAAIAAGLARGDSLAAAVGRAKRYVTRALASAVTAGGPWSLDHGVRPDDG